MKFSRDQRQRLTGMLLRLPNIGQAGVLRALLVDLPSGLVSNIVLSGAPATDLTNLITSAQEWGQDPNDGSWPVALLIENARGMVQGSQLERDLATLQNEVSVAAGGVSSGRQDSTDNGNPGLQAFGDNAGPSRPVTQGGTTSHGGAGFGDNANVNGPVIGGNVGAINYHYHGSTSAPPTPTTHADPVSGSPTGDEQAEIKLTGAQRKQFEQALLSAFRNYSSLQRMVRLELENNLDAIVPSGTLVDVVSNLVEWAIGESKVRILLIGALTANNGNLDLRAFGRSVGVEVKAE